MSTAQKLMEIGFDMPDEWLAIFLLAGLSDEYSPMIMAMESSGKTLSSDDVKTKLLQESSNNASSDQKAFFAKNRNTFNKKMDLICYSCRQKGHKSSSCPEKSKRSDENSQKYQKVNKSSDSKSALITFSAVFLSRKYGENSWYLDSGATKHMTMHNDWITVSKKHETGNIRAANGELMKVESTGAVSFCVDVDKERKQVKVEDVLCVPDLTANLLSVSQITSKGNEVIFYSKGCVIRNSHGDVLATGTMSNGLYQLDGSYGSSGLNSSNETALAAAKVNGSMELWHRRFAHVNYSDLSKMRNGAVTGMSYVDEERNGACVVCCKGRQTRKSYKRKGSRANQLLEVI